MANREYGWRMTLAMLFMRWSNTIAQWSEWASILPMNIACKLSQAEMRRHG